MFQRPEVEDVAALIKRWEERNQTDLRKLVALINKILDVVKGCGGNAIVEYDVREDKLVVWKFDVKKMLPKDLYSKWDERDKSEAEINTEHDADTESAVKPVDGVETKAKGKCIVFGPGDTKGKKATEAAKDTDSGSQGKGEHLAADSGETLLSSS